MKVVFPILGLCALAMSSPADGIPAVTSLHQLTEAVRATNLLARLDLVCTVRNTIHKFHGALSVLDETGHETIVNRSATSSLNLRFGDRVNVKGFVDIIPWPDSPKIFGLCTNIEILARNTFTNIPSQTLHELNRRRPDGRPVSVTGTVRDICTEGHDARWFLLVLQDGDDYGYVSVEKRDDETMDVDRLLGARVCVVGCHSSTSPQRQAMCSFVSPDSLRMITVLAPPPAIEETAVPDISDMRFQNIGDNALHRRHSAEGCVITTWNNTCILLRTDQDKLVKGELQGQRLPHVGERILLVGTPETDLFVPILSLARWQSKGRPNPSESRDDVRNITALDIRTDQYGSARFNGYYYGRRVRLRGIVRGLPAGNGDNIIYLESAGQMAKIDTTLLPEASWRPGLGDRIEITGICVFDVDKTTVNHIIPRISDYRIILQRQEDVRIIATPSWWTVPRLTALVCTLLAILVAILVWNIALRRVAARKGRELFREQLGHVKADLRTEERTRLAVELHDTLAQNLTGVSMEIEAANDLRGDAPKPMLDHLDIAAKALKSCRDELRNCLWDLRSQALEEPDMSKAVLKTLLPIINDSRLAVRFNVPRARLSDNTAHALLRVIRELVINAIRHGNASSIKVAGIIDQGKLLCSVMDDGCGFDPATAPSILQGHFGLQGIQERVNEIDGTFEISSAPGKGTKAVIVIPIPHDSGGISGTKSIV